MAEQQNPLAGHLERAAAALTSDATLAALSADDSRILRYLGYDDGDTAEAERRARMLRAAAKLHRLFLLPIPDAPGVVFFGGEADPALLDPQQVGSPIGSLAGSGLSPQRAFEACVGEGIEYLSQFVRADDPIEFGPLANYGEVYDPDTRRFISAVLAFTNVDSGQSIAWIAARRVRDGAPVQFPVDLCCRRPASQQDLTPPLKLSTGCAAGPTVEAAALHAALELVERDAVALWWRGGRRGRPIAEGSAAGREAAELLAQMRRGKADRQSWLLEITTDIGIPAVVAVSTGSDGFGCALGFAARLSLSAAARAAIFELIQMELGQHVVAEKRRESGDEGLNENDRRQLRLATLFDTKACGLLRPEGEPSGTSGEVPDDPAIGLQRVHERLEARGIAVHMLDLTRPGLEVPVVRILAPALQLEPCQIVSARLAQTARETGGGTVDNGGMPIL
jgi:ribosomal protein S12 methylthiotransferase accessory factor